MKCLTRQAAIERYGAIDFATRHWADMSKWMVILEIPRDHFPSLTVMQTGIRARHIACNRDLVLPLNDALENLITLGLDDQLITYDGCQNIRLVRGSTTEWSAHSWGLAIDFNAATNPLGEIGDMSNQVANCFAKQGFDWGRKFPRIDSMHYSFCWEHST